MNALLIWASMPESMDYYVLPGDVAEASKDVLEGANHRYFNGDEDIAQVIVVSDRLGAPEHAENPDNDPGSWLGYKIEDPHKVNEHGPFSAVYITGIYL